MESRRDLEGQEWLCFQTLHMDGTTSTRESSYSQGIRQYFNRQIRPHLTRKFFGILICGQCLSLLLCATGVANQKLVIACGIKIPGFIAFCSYMLLAIVFTTKLFWKADEAILILKERWWKYIIIAMVDVYANFLVFTAYEYTSLTSVQLLDCLSIPVVVFLSIAFLKAKYRPVHFCGVFVCVAGLGFMVWADFTSRSQGPHPGNHHSALLGDLLVIAGACLYAVSNIAEEFVVKTSTITEFLGMMTFFASFFSGANVILFERSNLSHAIWNLETILYLVLNVISLFLFYFLMPLLIYHSSATMVNLMLLTADLYSLFAGLYLFDYKFSNLYIYSFVVILLGVITFKVFPTPSRVDSPTSEREGQSVTNSSDENEESLTERLIQ